MLTNLGADGAETRLIQLASSSSGASPAHKQAPDPNILPEAKKALAESQKSAAALELLFSNFDFANLTDDELEAVTELVSRSTHPAECWKALHNADRWQKLPRSYQEQLSTSIAGQALGQQNPKLAAAIYTELIREPKNCSVTTLEGAITSFRFVQKSAEALRTMEELKSRQALTLAQRQLEIDLSREVLDFGRAYACLKALYLEQKELLARERTLSELIACSDETQRENEMAGILGDFIEKCPENTLTLDQLAKKPPPDTPEAKSHGIYAKRAHQYAQFLEWAAKPDYAKSLLYYTRAAAAGHREALKRAGSLSEELASPRIFTELLRLICPLADHPEYTKELADGYATEGNYPEALKKYKEYLAATSLSDVETVGKVGLLLLELDQPEEAEKMLRIAAEGSPEELKMRKVHAETLVGLKRYEEALAAYQSIPEELCDLETNERYQVLAEGMGNLTLAAQISERMLHRNPSAKARHWQDVAEIQFAAGQNAKAVQTLRQARIKFPQSKMLFYTLVDYLCAEQNYEAARQVVAKGDPKDLKTACLMVDVYAHDDKSEVLNLLPKPVSKAHAWPQDVATELGYLCSTAGDTAEAETLFKLAAKAGDTNALESLRSLASEDDPSDMRRLGDTLSALGQTEEAQKAYQRALTLIQEQAAAAAVEEKEARATEAPLANPTAPAAASE